MEEEDHGAPEGGRMPVRLSSDEFDRRRKTIQAEMEKRGFDALCVFSPAQVFYLTGFSFIATERPIGALQAGERLRLALRALA